MLVERSRPRRGGDGPPLLDARRGRPPQVNPVKAMASMDETFKRFENHEPPIDLTLPKLAFVGCNCAMLAVALWKLNTMGLLPITAADWTSFLVDKVHVEASGAPVHL